MRYRPRASLCLTVVLASCGRDAGRALTHRGFEAGMPDARFRMAAAAVGPLQCGPFSVAGVAASQLCSASNASSGLRVVATLGAVDSTVRYIVVQEPDTGAAGFAALVRAWGAPDTLVETGRRWRNGQWIADADTVSGRLTIWLTDTASELRVARYSLAAQQAIADTLPLSNELSAVLDTIQRMSPAGAPIPATPGEVDAPPRVIHCAEATVPDALAGTDGSVSLVYVVDTSGRAEAASIRVIEASRRGFIAPAAAMIRTCTFTPGRERGRPLRVLVRQQVGFRPRRAT